MIAYPSGQDGAILPARDCPFCSHNNISPNSKRMPKVFYSRSIKKQHKKENLTNIQPSWPRAWSMIYICCFSDERDTRSMIGISSQLALKRLSVDYRSHVVTQMPLQSLVIGRKLEWQFLTNGTRNLNQLQFAMFLSPSLTLMSNSSSAWCCSSDWFSGGLLRNETSIIFKGRTNQFLLWHQLYVKRHFPAIGFVSCPASLSQKFLSFPAFIKQLYQDVRGWGISYYNLHIWE